MQVYSLPLLPGYGASTKIRSSPAVKSPGGVSLLERMTIAEDLGYDDSYFPTMPDENGQPRPDPSEYILSHSPPSPLMGIDVPNAREIPLGHGDERDQAIEETHDRLENGDGLSPEPGGLGLEEDVSVRAVMERERERDSEGEGEAEAEQHVPGTTISTEHPGQLNHIPSTALSPSELAEPSHPKQSLYHQQTQQLARQRRIPVKRRKSMHHTNQVAEAVFFSYGVSVFFGFQEGEERDVMEDCEGAGAWIKGQEQDDWEVEEFHYAVSLSP